MIDFLAVALVVVVYMLMRSLIEGPMWPWVLALIAITILAAGGI